MDAVTHLAPTVGVVAACNALVRLGHKSCQINNIDTIDLNAYSIE